MTTKEQILVVLAAQSGPISRVDLAKELGEKSYSNFQSQLNTYEKEGFVAVDEQKHYILTDKGREVAAGKEEREEVAQSEEELGATEYQHFIKLGKNTGVVPLALIKQTTEHVWNGGDYWDLKWVAQAMMEMGIRSDLRTRWWNSWRSYLKQPPSDLPKEFFTGKDAKETTHKEEAASKGIRTHILDEDDKPVYVGEGLGDLNYTDALELAKMRAGARARTPVGQAQTVGSLSDDLVKVIGAIQALGSQRGTPKSYVVRPSEDGYQVEEVEEGKPVVVAPPGGGSRPLSYVVNSEGKVQEIPLGQPVVIQQPSPPTAQPNGRRFLIDKATGEMKEVAENQPIVIVRETAPSQAPVFQLTDAQGNPLQIDFSTWVKLDEHKAKQERDKEMHEHKVEITKSFKDLLSKATRAVGHMGEEGE